MAMLNVEGENFFDDPVLFDQIANILMFFLPGLSSGLMTIALENEKVGRKVIQVHSENFYF